MSEVLNLDNLEKHIRDNYLEKDFGHVIPPYLK